METVEKFLSGKESVEEYIHLTMKPEDKPDYMSYHEQRRTEAQIQNLEMDIKYDSYGEETI